MSNSHSDPSIMDAISALVIPDGVGTVKLDLARSPEAAEAAGRALAAQLSGYDLDIVFTWDQPDDAILAHVVARELGLRAVLFGVYEGVISVDMSLIRDRRVGLVVTRLSTADDCEVLSRFLSKNGASLAVAAEVLRGAELPLPSNARVALADPDQIHVS